MPVQTQEAIERKIRNKKHKADIAREAKITSLGGEAVNLDGVYLTTEERSARVYYLYDLLYPKRHNKDKTPRKYKYATAEEAKQAMADAQRRRYREKVNADPREYVTNQKLNEHCWTPWYVLYTAAKSRAKKAGIPFDLDIAKLAELYSQTKVCPLLHVEFETGTANGRSLDKIIPELGYVDGNVQILSRRANTIKNNATFEEFEKIYQNWKSLL